MSPAFPIRFADQMREHLRSLRKKRGLTQAQVGALMGVSQARIAEIEAKPGLVNFDQMLQLLSLLGASLSLAPANEPDAPEEPAATPPVQRQRKFRSDTPVSPKPGKNAPRMIQRGAPLRKKRGSW